MPIISFRLDAEDAAALDALVADSDLNRTQVITRSLRADGSIPPRRGRSDK